MKRKALISMIVVVCMTFALTVPALANGDDDDHANAPQDVDVGVEVMVPNPDFDPGEDEDPVTNPRFIPEPARPSHGRTTLTDFDDDDQDGDWELSLGDDTDQTEESRSNGVDIAVWAKIVDLGDADDLIYCVDIEWGNMRFVFGRNSGAWNPETRAYGELDEGSWWIDNEAEGDSPTEFYLDGINNRVTVTNRSNAAIDASFAYTFYSQFNGTPGGGATNNLFNKLETNEDLVVGNFFHVPTTAAFSLLAQAVLATPADWDAWILNDAGNPTNEDEIRIALAAGYAAALGAAEEVANFVAILASKILEDEGDSVQEQVEVVEPDIWLDPAAPVRIASAAVEEDSPHSGNEGTLPRESVMFAFSGTPDEDSVLVGAPFTKVGVITVTITPADPTDPGGGTGGG